MIFIDTSAFYALADQGENNHLTAKNIIENIIVKSSYKMITTDYIIDETLTLISKRVGKYYSLMFLDNITASDLLKIIKINENQFFKTIELFKRYENESFSFTDCSSFVIISDLKIEKVFTFDKHFEILSIEILP